jgi:hypothetical protein
MLSDRIFGIHGIPQSNEGELSLEGKWPESQDGVDVHRLTEIALDARDVTFSQQDCR